MRPDAHGYPQSRAARNAAPPGDVIESNGNFDACAALTRIDRGSRLATSATEVSAMTVKAILDSKGNNVVTIEPTASLAAAVKVLADRRIGALVIFGADRRVVGILSERDIVRAFAERGERALDEPVGQVMTRKVVTCTSAETIGAIMERMTARKFRHVPVVEDGQLVGIVSIGDVVKHRLHEIEHESAALRDYILTA
jgi:CBS domain-containing protein